MNTQTNTNLLAATSLAESSAIQLIHAENWLLSKAKTRVNASGITFQQFNILSILYNADGPLSLQNIQERLPEKRSDVSRLVDRMISKKFLNKVNSTTDKRKVEILLTETGKKKYAEVKEKGLGFENLHKKLTLEELQMLNYLLRKIC